MGEDAYFRGSCRGVKCVLFNFIFRLILRNLDTCFPKPWLQDISASTRVRGNT